MATLCANVATITNESHAFDGTAWECHDDYKQATYISDGRPKRNGIYTLYMNQVRGDTFFSIMEKQQMVVVKWHHPGS